MISKLINDYMAFIYKQLVTALLVLLYKSMYKEVQNDNPLHARTKTMNLNPAAIAAHEINYLLTTNK